MKPLLKEITPALAAKYLESNTENRKLRKRLVTRYARLMKKGKWIDETGEPIQFDTKGLLKNGQHRLQAIVESDTTHTFLVVEDISEEAFAVIDNGLKRNGSDVLQIEGARSHTQLSGIIRKYLMLKSGKYGEQGGDGNVIENEDILKEYKKHKGWWDQVNDQTGDWYRAFQKTIPPSDIGGFYAYLNDFDEEAVSRFFDKLCNGTELAAGSPIKKLRDMLYNAKRSQSRRFTSYHRSALIIKAWNFFKSKQAVERLTFDIDKEKFPRPNK
jgi:hypothetical protein